MKKNVEIFKHPLKKFPVKMVATVKTRIIILLKVLGQVRYLILLHIPIVEKRFFPQI